MTETLVEYRKSQTSIMSNPNVEYIESLLRIFEKYFSINSDIDKAINEKISQFALTLYMLGSKSSTKWLYKKLKFKFGISNFFYFLISLLRIDYKLLIKVKTFFK